MGSREPPTNSWQGYATPTSPGAVARAPGSPNPGQSVWDGRYWRSPDGTHIWDGRSWVPADPRAVVQSPTAPPQQERARDKRHPVKWLWTALAVPVIISLVTFAFTHPGGLFNPQAPPPAPAMGGSVDSVTLSQSYPCCKFVVKMTLDGYDGQKCPIQANVVNEFGQNGGFQEVGTFTPASNADEDSLEVPITIDAPGTYTIYFRLMAPNGDELDRNQTTITVR